MWAHHLRSNLDVSLHAAFARPFERFPCWASASRDALAEHASRRTQPPYNSKLPQGPTKSNLIHGNWTMSATGSNESYACLAVFPGGEMASMSFCTWEPLRTVFSSVLAQNNILYLRALKYSGELTPSSTSKHEQLYVICIYRCAHVLFFMLVRGFDESTIRVRPQTKYVWCNMKVCWPSVCCSQIQTGMPDLQSGLDWRTCRIPKECTLSFAWWAKDAVTCQRCTSWQATFVMRGVGVTQWGYIRFHPGLNITIP